MFQKSKPDFLALFFRLFSVVPYGLTKTTIRTHDALVDGMDYISKVVIKDREEYYSDYQTTFEDLMLLAFSLDKEQEAHCLTTLISLLSVETMQYVFEPAWSTNPTYLPHKRIEDINQRFRNKCGEYKFIIGNSDQNQMVHNLVLADVRRFQFSAPYLSSHSLLHHTSGIPQYFVRKSSCGYFAFWYMR